MKNLVITLALMVGVTGMAQAKGDAAACARERSRLAGTDNGALRVWADSVRARKWTS